jgi:hypothetical protein
MSPSRPTATGAMAVPSQTGIEHDAVAELFNSMLEKRRRAFDMRAPGLVDCVQQSLTEDSRWKSY